MRSGWSAHLSSELIRALFCFDKVAVSRLEISDMQCTGYCLCLYFSLLLGVYFYQKIITNPMRVKDRSKMFCNILSVVWTDHWERPWRTCTRSTGSRADCTEAFLSTTSAASPPRPWPSPPTSSWSRSSTWTSCRFFILPPYQPWPVCSESPNRSTSMLPSLSGSSRFVLNNVPSLNVT